MRDFVFESMAMRVVEVMTLAEEIAFRKVDQRLAAHLLARFEADLERAGALSLSRGRIQLLRAEGLRRVAAGSAL